MQNRIVKCLLCSHLALRSDMVVRDNLKIFAILFLKNISAVSLKLTTWFQKYMNPASKI